MPETLSTRRLRWLLWAFLLWAVAIFGKLISLQVLHHDDLVKLAQQQQQKMVEIEAPRGTMDRPSRVVSSCFVSGFSRERRFT